MQRMTHSLLLRFEIPYIIFVRCNFDRYILYDFEAVRFQSDSFHWVVGEEPHFVYTKFLQYLCPAAIVALVGLKAQMSVRIYCVKSVFLQLDRKSVV